MRRKQTIFGRMRQILWICSLACLHCVYAVEIRPYYTAGAPLENGLSANDSKGSNDCFGSNGVDNPSKQGHGRVKCCIHCTINSGIQHASIVQSKSVAVIDILLPIDDEVLGWMEDTNAPLLPKELLVALLATRGPPHFS